jgi:two-component system sensor histidine kinase PilS (NtrC family)
LQQQLVRYRMLVAAISLPLGFLLGSGPPFAQRGADLLLVSGVVAGLSVIYLAGLHWGRWPRAQISAQIAIDVLLVTWVALETGGRHSQFVLFYVLVVLYAGIVFATRGGLLAAIGVAGAYLSLPWLVSGAASSPWQSVAEELIRDPAWPLAAGLFIAVGILGGIVGRKVRRSSATLARAAREVKQVRLDTERILASMSSGVLTLDADLRVLHANQAAADVLGIPIGEFRGRLCRELLGPDQDTLLERVEHTLDAGRAQHRQEIEITDREGNRRPVGLSTSILTDEFGDKRGVVAVFADLSEFKAVEERARRSETLAAIGELSAAIAHEIRNAVVPMAGSVEILVKELELEDENQRLLDLVSRECSRLNRFVSELLDYVREAQVHVEMVNLMDLMEEVLELIHQHPTAESLRVRIECEGDEFCARADGEQLKRAFVNLAQNAVEAMDGAGELTVLLGTRGEAVTVSFRDTGPGIAPENRHRIMEPFFTTKRGGTGLGLSTASRVIERLGGSLEVTSSSSEGTTVTVELPQVVGTSLAA